MNWIVRREFLAGPLDGLVEEARSYLTQSENPHKISPHTFLKRNFAGKTYLYALAGAFVAGDKVVFRYKCQPQAATTTT